jgi:hypothetical protein
MAKYFFATFWFIVFTGSVRKWMFPGVTALYLLQDVPIGLAYLYAIRRGVFSRGYLLLGTVILSLLITLQALAQIIFSGLNPITAFIGLHNYLFYLPMLVVFPIVLTVKYRRKYAWWNLIFSIPMCLLALAQNASPKSAFVNKSSEGEAFGVPGAEVARVSGTFNFTFFYGIWVDLAVALCMGEWLLPKERRAIKSTWLMVLCTLTVNLCHLISASRGAIVGAALAVVGAMVAAVVLRSGRAMLAIGALCVLLPLASVMTYYISPDEFNVVLDRFTSDNAHADSQTRAITAVIGFATIPKFSLLGAGVGMGIDAAHVGSVDAYNFTYDLAEQDIVRTVMELGTPIGLIYAITRVCFSVGMIFFAIRLVRSGSSPHVLPLAFVLASQVYTSDMTRAATMTTTQAMMGYAFILGAFYHPDNTSPDSEAVDSPTRSM